MFALVLNCELMASQKPPSVDGESVTESACRRNRYFEIFALTCHPLGLLLSSDPLHCPIL